MHPAEQPASQPAVIATTRLAPQNEISPSANRKLVARGISIPEHERIPKKKRSVKNCSEYSAACLKKGKKNADEVHT